MEKFYKEPTPVQYSAAGFKRDHYHRSRNLRLHWHDRLELIRLHSGTMQVGYGENTAIVSPGQLYIVPPKTPHMAKLLTEQAEYDVLMFDVRRFYNETQTAQALLPGIFDGRAKFQMVSGAPQLIAAFDTLYGCCEEDSLQTLALAYSLLHLLLQYALVEFTQTAADAVIAEVLEYIRTHYHEELTTQGLAQQFGYSEAHFCRKFKETTWLTPMNYLRIIRLEEAAKQLKQGSGSVSQVALACGFPDPNYFTRCFKSHFGVPPTRYEK